MYIQCNTCPCTHVFVCALITKVELDSLQHRAIEIADRLVCRPEDMEVRVQEEIQHYHAAMLRFLEDYMIQHSQQHVIELDANLSPQELFRVGGEVFVHVHVTI